MKPARARKATDRQLTCVVFQDDRGFVARCLDVEVTSDGDTEEDAVAHLREALDLYFEDSGMCLDTLPARSYRLEQVGIRKHRT